MARFDLDRLKYLAAGRWPELLGLNPEILDTRHHPCPKCGGKDRFRALSDFRTSGAVVCNQCLNRSNGDGIATYSWLHGCSTAAAIEQIADRLGLDPIESKATSPSKAKPPKSAGKSGESKKSASERVECRPLPEAIAHIFAARKGNIAATSLAELGAQLANHNGLTVIALPIRSVTGQPVGYALANSTGGKITIHHPDGGSETTSWKNVIDTKAKGIIGTANLFDANARAALTTIFKMEGPSDLAAIIPLLQPGEGAFCNPAGAGENPVNFPWLLEWLENKLVVVIHDRDKAGVDGALGHPGRARLGWATWAAGGAAEVRMVELPFPLADSHGKDFRDWVGGGGDRAGLDHLVETAQIIDQLKVPIVEHEDDPHRLARVNMERYMLAHGRRLVYWQSEWYRWKSGKYIKIEVDELKAKVSNAIRAEFENLWPAKLEKYNEWRASDKYEPALDKGPPPIQKVTRNLVSNVIGAMEGMAAIPGSIKMPCWLPDRSNRHYVSMGNGILDLEKVCDGKPMEEFLLPHSHEWFSTFQLEYDYSKTAQCPKWLDYLDFVMSGDRDRIAILQEWAGYLLTPTNDLQKFLVLEGEGQNGKTVYFAAIRAMLGEENISNVPLENFGGQFDLEATLGKAANISGDTDELDRVSEGALKKFTGGDTMQFDRKNIRQISARPTAKLMCAWNKRPHFRDRSKGLWRRMVLIPFDRIIPEERRVLGMDKPEWWLESGEVPGILRWAIIGLDRLKENRAFTSSQKSTDEMSDYQKETNPAREFLVDHLKAGDQEITVECGLLYRLYVHWCEYNGHKKPLANTSFGKEVARCFPESTRERLGGGGRPWVYRGIQFTVSEISGHEVKQHVLEMEGEIE